MPSLALCAVVTHSVLAEFQLLKQSLELYHAERHQWFVRCDRQSLPVLARHDDVTCRVFAESVRSRVPNLSASFRGIVVNKMLAIGDAWESGTCDAVAYLDSDLLITAPFIDDIGSPHIDLVLTPNYYPWKHQHLAPVHGYFNSGFVWTAAPSFHEEWQRAFNASPWLFTDQACLNEVVAGFRVGLFDERANVGFWRSQEWESLRYDPIPAHCQFLHTHFLQPLECRRDWVDRTFSLHCLRFLHTRGAATDKVLIDLVLKADVAGWYAASFELSS